MQYVAQCVADCCDVLQCVAVCCSVLQRVVQCVDTETMLRSSHVCGTVFHCVMVCCSVGAECWRNMCDTTHSHVYTWMTTRMSHIRVVTTRISHIRVVDTYVSCTCCRHVCLTYVS